MARFGTGIQAGLGAINYTPYMQGALAGSQSIAQGIAGLGQAASGAIREYRQKKEDEKKIGETINFLETNFKKDPGTYAMFDDGSGNFDRDAANAALRSVGANGVMTFINFSQAAQANRDIKAEKQEEKRILKAVENIQGITDDVVKDMALNSSDDAVRAAYQRKLMDDQMRETQLQLARSQIAENLAKARAVGMPKPEDLTFQEQTLNEAVKAEEVRLGRKLTPAESFDVRKMVIGLTGQKGTTINMPGEDNTSENLYKNLQAEKTASIQPIIDADSINSTLNDLLKNSDLITGKTAQAEMFVKSIGNDLGITDFKDVKNTQLFISLVGQRIKSSIKAFGSATAVSDGDRIYTEKIEGGDITSQLEGIKQLQTILNDQARKKINNFNKRVERVFPDQGRYKAALIVSEEEAPFTLQQPDYIYRGGRLVPNPNKN
jgi:hypothetical protein